VTPKKQTQPGVTFRAERDTLVDAARAAARAVSGRGGSLPVLTGLRIAVDTTGQVTLCGSDLDLTIIARTNAAVTTPGVFVVSANLFTDVVRSVEPGSIDVTVTDDEVAVTAGRFRTDLRLLPSDEYPRLGEIATAPVTVDAAGLLAAAAQVTPAASADDNRPILTGILFEPTPDGLRLVATDSYRLALRTLTGLGNLVAEDRKLLVPARTMREVNRLLPIDGDVQVTIGERDVAFANDRLEVRSRTIEGDFPNYRGLLPDLATMPSRFTVDRAAFVEAVTRVKLMARESTPVRCAFADGGELTLRAITQDIGQANESLSGDLYGAPVDVAFNPDYLLDGLSLVGTDQVQLGLVDQQKPALIAGVDDTTDFRMLLMPVRV